jgi:hypothetical protein
MRSTDKFCFRFVDFNSRWMTGGWPFERADRRMIVNRAQSAA